MGIISSLFNKFIDNRSYKTGKGIARAMFISALAMKEYYNDSTPEPAFIAGKALDARHKWKRIDEVTFEHEPSETQIKISGKISIKDVIHMIVEVEIEYIFNSLPYCRIEELLEYSNNAVNDYFKKQKNSSFVERVDNVDRSQVTADEIIAVANMMRDIEATRLVKELSEYADTLPEKKIKKRGTKEESALDTRHVKD